MTTIKYSYLRQWVYPEMSSVKQDWTVTERYKRPKSGLAMFPVESFDLYHKRDLRQGVV